ncbi:glycosyltransferase [Phycisphaerales bacterium AB-hyl4]|uniref:Glycosyltransferase n=1 Tax=Natronomicrosphaera hydrolytica TaxID=3242702 RepID=A0ABV4U9S9_9BACT
MHTGMNIAFFGSSLVSAYWNGAATYYRGIIRALHERGHRVTFYEPAAFDRQAHRDIDDPDWAKVVVYSAADTDELRHCLEEARQADLVVKASGVGVFDAMLESAVLELRRAGNMVAFWDVDAPATLERLTQYRDDAFIPLVPKYDLILTYGGGEPVVNAYLALGAKRCVPIYNALDPQTHFPVRGETRFDAELALLANRLPDREARVDAFFFDVACQLPRHRFLLGGNGWHDRPVSDNVRYLGHVYTHDHNAFNSSPLAVLNISRASMARFGFSPATRLFEAAGAGACMITDAWAGLEQFFEPGEEILVARDGEAVVEHLLRLTPMAARAIGTAARQRVLAEHTYAHRAAELEAVLDATPRGGALRTGVGQYGNKVVK